MAKYIINGRLYNTKKMMRVCSAVTFNIYFSNNERRDFIMVDTIFGFKFGHARKISENDAKYRIGRRGLWKEYERLWGIPEDNSSGGRF